MKGIIIILLLGMFLTGTLLFACAQKVAPAGESVVPEIPVEETPVTGKEP